MNKQKKITLKDVRENVIASTHSVRNGVFTVRDSFFYRHGRTEQDLINKVLNAFPNAKILESGEVWKAFRGGASVASQSHWFVKFTFDQ